MDFMSERLAVLRAADASYPSSDERLVIRQLTASARAYATLLELASSPDALAQLGRDTLDEEGARAGAVAARVIRRFIAMGGGVPGVLLVLPEEVS